ncbi:MAG TPA: TetR/AcrR family transcriptional regulator [Candidatus Dormibacteraeota bacterium]
MAAVAGNREERRGARKQRLVEAAMRLFARDGFNETSVDDIVAEARTSKSAFYEFWTSKEDCVRDLLEEQGGALIAEVFEFSAEGGDHRARLRRGIAHFVRYCMARAQLARLLLVESVGVNLAVEEARHRVLGRFAHIVEAEVRAHGAADPFYRDIDPEVFGRAVVGAVYEATSHFLVDPDVDLEALIRGLCAIFAPET